MDHSPFVVEPIWPHTHSLILLHSLGSNGEKFGREFIETGICSDGKSLPDLLPGARFIFPTSKRRRTSAFRRARLTQWFDIALLEDPSYRSHTQHQGMEESSREIFDLISQEREKVSERNIVLGGISQGCAMGLVCLLAFDFPLGGFIGMSSWLPFSGEFEQLMNEVDDVNFSDEEDNPFAASDDGNDTRSVSAKVHEHARELLSLDPDDPPGLGSLPTPVFMGHGKADEKIKPELGKDACRVLRSVGFEVEWKSYDGLAHWYKVPDEIDDI
ncbi:hypothetical protein ACLX1H_000596 [Fusarium chlamydosporum]